MVGLDWTACQELKQLLLTARPPTDRAFIECQGRSRPGGSGYVSTGLQKGCLSRGLKCSNRLEHKYSKGSFPLSPILVEHSLEVQVPQQNGSLTKAQEGLEADSNSMHSSVKFGSREGTEQGAESTPVPHSLVQFP